MTGVSRLEALASRMNVRIARLERRVRLLAAALRVALILLRIPEPSFSSIRVSDGDKRRLLRAIDRSRCVLGLRRILRIVGLSPSRLHAWRTALRACELPEQVSCPTSSPHRLTVEEIAKIRDMVKAPEFRHVPTGRLAILAQRIGVVFASPSTWLRLVREKGWRRPRLRVHPEGPKFGIRAERPNDIWHIDTTVIRLLDGTRVYLHAVIDISESERPVKSLSFAVEPFFWVRPTSLRITAPWNSPSPIPSEARSSSKPLGARFRRSHLFAVNAA